MAKKKAFQRAPRQRDMLSVLVDKGNLRVGCLLGCVINGKLLKVGVAKKGEIQCCCDCRKTYLMTFFESHAGSKHKKGSKAMFLLDGSFKSDGSLKSLADLRDEPESSSVRDEAEASPGRGRRTLEEKDSTCDFCLTPRKDLPNGQWYCPKCTCRLCKVNLRGNTDPITTNVKELLCALCGDQYHKNCVEKKGRRQFREDVEWFCSEYCEKAFQVLEPRVKSSLGPKNPHKLSLVRWTGGYVTFPITEENSDAPECSSELLRILKQKAVEARKLYFVLDLLKRSFEDVDRVRNQESLFQTMLFSVLSPEHRGPPHARCLDHHGFYTVLYEKDDNIMAIATIRIHRQEVAKMPFITTPEAHRGQGFCHKLVKHLKKMLKKIGVKTLVVQSPPDFQEMWPSKYSFHPVKSNATRSLLESNLLKLDGTTLLCKKIKKRRKRKHEQSVE